MLTIGIDPDSKDLAIACWDSEAGYPLHAFVIHAVGNTPRGETAQVRMARLLADTIPGIIYDDPATVAIEGQQIDRRKTGTGDLFKLAHVTGAAMLWSAQQWPDARIVVPTPTQWKGQVVKHAHQARLYQELGWGYEIVGSGKTGKYARPLHSPAAFSHISRGQWRHVGDALLLARWAQTQ